MCLKKYTFLIRNIESGRELNFLIFFVKISKVSYKNERKIRRKKKGKLSFMNNKKQPRQSKLHYSVLWKSLIIMFLFPVKLQCQCFLFLPQIPILFLIKMFLINQRVSLYRSTMMFLILQQTPIPFLITSKFQLFLIELFLINQRVSLYRSTMMFLILQQIPIMLLITSKFQFCFL